MLTSLGFHTFTIFKRLTYSEAIELYKTFQEYSDLRVRPAGKNEGDTYPKGYIAEYIGLNKGITWYIRFDDKLSEIMEKYPKKDQEPTPYSIRATINPKVLIGIRDYLTAASSYFLDDVENQFNIEAAKISPVLGRFEDYSMNRVDYCLNTDLAELKTGCSPPQMMALIRRGNIPKCFTEWAEYNDKSHRKEANKDTFYLQSNSLTINCYLKYEQLLEEFPDCPGLEDSRNLIRFEVQCKYPKVYSLAKKDRYNSGLYKSMSEEELWDELQYGRIITNPPDVMLSDSVASDIVRKYFDKVIGNGDYYSLEIAKKKVQSENCRQKVRDRLIRALSLVNRYRGIAKAKTALHGEELENFKRSLKGLRRIGINPVTIPRKWGIPHIRNLFDAYLDKIADEQAKERYEQWNRECFEEYIKDCRKQGKSWIKKMGASL
jgi:hypothetical protein